MTRTYPTPPIDTRKRRRHPEGETSSDESRLTSPSVTDGTSSYRPSVPGFLGSTSYAAVFAEGHESINVEAELESPEDISGSKQSSNYFPLGSSKVKEGARILAQLRDLKKYPQTIDRWYNRQCLTPLIPFIKDCIDILMTDELLKSSSCDSRLMERSRKVLLCTTTTFDLTDIKKPSDFPFYVMGDHLRFEVVGLMLASAGMGAISLEELSLDYEDEFQWKDIAKAMLRASDQCIALCQEIGNLSDLGIWHILVNHIFHTQVDGDVGKSTAHLPLEQWIMGYML